VIDVETRVLILQAWDGFKDEYNDEIFRPLIVCIEKGWFNGDAQQCILRYYTDIYLHFDFWGRLTVTWQCRSGFACSS